MMTKTQTRLEPDPFMSPQIHNRPEPEKSTTKLAPNRNGLGGSPLKLDTLPSLLQKQNNQNFMISLFLLTNEENI